MKVLKDIFSVSSSTIIGIGTSFLINFMLPIILSLEDYGQYQKFITLLSFTYLLNLGYNDGIYIKYGGKNINEIDNKTIHQEHNFVVIFQSLILLLTLSYGIWQKNLLLIFFFIASLFDAINNYHANLLKATGEFKTYSRGFIFKSLNYILLLLIAIFMFKFDRYYIYIGLNIISLALLTLFFERYFYKTRPFEIRINVKSQIPIFKVGIIILISNASLTFVGNIGRIIAGNTYPSEQFAQYGFQNSLLNLMLVLTNAVGIVFYNVIAKKDDKYLLNIIKQTSLLIGILSGLGFFALEIVVQIIMPKYTPALSLLAITFISIPYIIVSKMLIANLYKAKTSNKIYLRDSILYAALSFVFVYVLHWMKPGLETIAWATTICYIVWIIYTTTFRFKYLKNSSLDIVILISHAFIFYIITANFSSIIGFFAYLIFLLVIIFIKRSEIREVVQFLAK